MKLFNTWYLFFIMALKYRLTWMQLHTYLSCFFFPIALVFIISGSLYLLDIEGGHTGEYEYAIELPEGWPQDEAEAKKLILPIIEKYGHDKLPPDFYFEDNWVGWFGYKQEVFIDPSQNIKHAKLHVNKHDFLHQLLLIHKGHAGLFFRLLAILFGISLFISVLTGLVLALSISKLRVPALWCTCFGLSTLMAAYLLG